MRSSATVGFGGAGGERTFFTEQTTDGRERLVAIVLQRGLVAKQDPRGLAWLRRFAIASPARFRIDSRFMFVSMFARRLFLRRGTYTLPPGFNSGTNMGQADEVLYSSAKRLVRVAGRELAIPDGQASIVVMVRHDQTKSAAKIVTHLVDVPTMPTRQVEPRIGQGSAGQAMADHFRAQDATWNAALFADPVIRAFLDRPE